MWAVGNSVRSPKSLEQGFDSCRDGDAVPPIWIPSFLRSGVFHFSKLRIMKTWNRLFGFSVISLIALLLSMLGSSRCMALPKVLVMAAESDSWTADVQTKLQNTGQFAQVDRMVVPYAGGSIPTLSQLQAYDAVLVFGDYGMESGEGSVLASYVDGGGAVVLATFCLSYTQIDAAFNNSTYQVIVPGGGTTGEVTLGTVAQPNHPIMKGISSMDGGSSNYRGTSTTLAGNAYAIAYWSDGTILVAARENVGLKNVRRADVNLFPVSSDMRSDFWHTNTDGAKLLANALTWVANTVPPPVLSLEPHTLNFGTLPVHDSETYCVTASSIGASMLHIQGFSLTDPQDYTIVSGPQVGDSVAPGNSVQFCIKFKPVNSGPRIATFTLRTDGADSGTQVVNLSGSVLAPNISYGVTSLFHNKRTMLGDTSPVLYIPVSSIGQSGVTFNSIYFIGLDADDYFITHLPQNPLLPDVTDSIGIRFAPEIEGRPDAKIVINTDAFNIPIDTIPLYGIGTLPHLVVSVQSPGAGNTAMFDSVAVGDSVCQTLLLTNPGTDTLHILKQIVTYGDYDFTYYPLTGTDTIIVPGGGSQLADVCFKPLKVGTRLATIRFYTNIPRTFTKPSLDTSEFDINVTGIGVPYGHLFVQGSLNDTAVVGQSHCISDTLVNNGQAPLTVTGAALTGPGTSAFTLTGATVPFTLEPGQQQIVSLCFAPAARGTQFDTLTLSVTTSEKSVVQALLLGGVGVEECVSSDSVIRFGATDMTLVGSADTSCITVTNCGDLPATYSAAAPVGADYTLLPPMTSPQVAPGGTASFCAVFTPTAIGAEDGSVTITGGPSAVTTRLAGVGAGVQASATGALAAPVAVGLCQPFPVRVTNNGNVPWTPGTGSIGGPNAADFTIQSGPTPSVIPAGGTASVVINFCPTLEGTETMTLTFPAARPMPLTTFSYNVSGVGAASGVALTTSQAGFELGQSYPNPTNGTAEIPVTLPRASHVRIDILNATGAVVRTAFTGMVSAGIQRIALDAKGLPSGTYFYMLTSGTVHLTRQLSVLK